MKKPNLLSLSLFLFGLGVFVFEIAFGADQAIRIQNGAQTTNTVSSSVLITQVTKTNNFNSSQFDVGASTLQIKSGASVTNATLAQTTTFSGSTFAALGAANGMKISGGQSYTNELPTYYTNAFHMLATLFDSTASAGASGAVWKSGGASAPAAWGTDNGSYGITFGGIGAGTTAAANSTVRAGLLSVNWNQYNTTSKSPYIIMKAGTITSVAYTVMGAGGDAVNTVSVSLLLNGTTVFATDTFTWTSFPIRRTVLTVSQAVTVNDYVEVQVVTPAGWTAPTTSSLGAMAMVVTTNN